MTNNIEIFMNSNMRKQLKLIDNTPNTPILYGTYSQYMDELREFMSDGGAPPAAPSDEMLAHWEAQESSIFGTRSGYMNNFDKVVNSGGAPPAAPSEEMIAHWEAQEVKEKITNTNDPFGFFEVKETKVEEPKVEVKKSGCKFGTYSEYLDFLREFMSSGGAPPAAPSDEMTAHWDVQDNGELCECMQEPEEESEEELEEELEDEYFDDQGEYDDQEDEWIDPKELYDPGDIFRPHGW